MLLAPKQQQGENDVTQSGQGLTVHLFTSSLTHAQRMISSTAGTEASSIGSSFSCSSQKSIDSKNSGAQREVLERIFGQESSSSGGSINSDSSSSSNRLDWRGVDVSESRQDSGPEIVIHLAEWACASQPARAKALGMPGLALTDEVQLAELCGCADSKAIMDGLEW